MTSNGRDPGFVVLTSAMRTGSTWLVKLLMQISQTRDHFAPTAEAVVKLIGERENGIIKSHTIIDQDWSKIPDNVPIVRITRNYKDSLISRALYVKNIRPSEGAPITEPEVLQLLAKLGDASEFDFIRIFIDECVLVERWLAEIAVIERGSDERCLTLMYESMMHNPYDVVLELTDVLWPGWTDAASRVEPAVRQSIRDGLRLRDTYLRSKAVGVGGWESWLNADQSERLDALYIKLRALAFENPKMRWQEVLKAYKAKR